MNAIIIFCANYLVIFVVITIVVAWILAKKDVKLRFLAQIILAGAIAYGLAKIAAALHYDPRPFVAEHIQPLITHAPDNGFPSDHALFTATLTATAFFFNRKIAWAMLAMTDLVGIARILALVHSPLDIAAGWVLGTIGAIVAYFVVRWAFAFFGRKKNLHEPLDA